MRLPMSLGRSSHVAALKNAKQPISVENRTSLEKKSATMFLCVKTASGKVVRHSLASIGAKNDWWGQPFYT